MLAAALGELKLLFPEGSERTAIEEAIASGGLVINENDHTVYWKGERIIEKMKGREWQLLISLAKKAMQHAAAGVTDVFNEPVQDTAMSTTWGRLKPKLPATLRKLVNPGLDRGTYFLDLEPNEVTIDDATDSDRS